MQEQNSGRFEIDQRNLIQIAGAAVVGALSIYSSNTEFFNQIIAQYVGGKTFVVVSMVLAYAVKKYLTDYKAT